MTRKYTSKETNIDVNYDLEIKQNWKKIVKSHKISLSKKIFIYLRIKFPILLGNLKKLFSYVRK